MSCSGALDRPFVVLLQQDRSDEADDGVVVGEDSDDLGPSFDLAVEPFETVGGVDFGPVDLGEFGMFPFLLKLYADGGYQGPLLRAALKKIMAQVNVEIVKRSDQAKAFVVLPRRWVVERTFAGL